MHDLKKIVKKILLENFTKHDCGCGCNGTAKCFDAPILNENLKSRTVITEEMQYHIDVKKPLFETTLPYGSKEYINLWAEARFLYSRGALNVEGIDKEKITETNLGEYGMYEGKKVPLDLPMLDEGIIEEKTPCWKGYKQIGMKEKNGKQVPNCVPIDEAEEINEAEYQGRKVTLNKPSQGDSKKFKVYVKNDKGKVVKVNFGFGGKSAKGKRMVIKDKNPKARAAYRARHHCKNPGPKWKANYWSCKAW